MSQQQFQSVVIEVLSEIQKLSGRKLSGLTPDATPIGDFEGFDSLSAIEATVMIEEKLDCELGVDSVFISESGKRALTVREIAERLTKLVQAKAGKG